MFIFRSLPRCLFFRVTYTQVLGNYESYLRQFHHDVIGFLSFYIVQHLRSTSTARESSPKRSDANSFIELRAQRSGSLSDHTFKSIASLIRLYMMKSYYRITACLPKSAVEMSAARCPIGSNSVSTLKYEIKILVLLRICSWCSWSWSFEHPSYRGVAESCASLVASDSFQS